MEDKSPCAWTTHDPAGFVMQCYEYLTQHVADGNTAKHLDRNVTCERNLTERHEGIFTRQTQPGLVSSRVQKRQKDGKQTLKGWREEKSASVKTLYPQLRAKRTEACWDIDVIGQ